MTIYKQLSLDLDKRHLIFGDIHGHFDRILALLDHVGYDPSKDVLYTTGDMVDRGPKNLDVFRFFTEDERRYSVLGNHEEMILDDYNYHMWIHNGGYQTMTELNDGYLSIEWFRKQIKKLPYIIDVGKVGDEGAFRILHAEIRPFYDERLIQLELAEKDPNFLNELIWGRAGVIMINKSPVIQEKVDQLSDALLNRQPMRTFVGHSVMEKPTTIGNRTYLDTGSGYKYHNLTLYNAITGEYYQSKDLE